MGEGRHSGQTCQGRTWVWILPGSTAVASPPIRGRRLALTAERRESDPPRMMVLSEEPDAAERTRRCGANPTLRSEPDDR
jgi:hypothetical protein